MYFIVVFLSSLSMYFLGNLWLFFSVVYLNVRFVIIMVYIGNFIVVFLSSLNMYFLGNFLLFYSMVFLNVRLVEVVNV